MSPTPFFAKRISVIGGQDNDAVIIEAARLKILYELAEGTIHALNLRRMLRREAGIILTLRRW